MLVSGEATILVVEDQPGLRALAEEVLNSAGYSVLMAQDGENALRVAKEHSGQIQLLLSDLTLPKVDGKEMSGKDVAALLQALQPDMKVLFMSGHARGAITANGALDPHANFIQKPWSPQGLCEEVRKALAVHPAAQRILVVDDEAGMREWLVEVLEGSGYRVFTAKDGLEARQLARRQSLDLTITDISMPNEDGLGIVRALRKEHPEIKIVVMSGSSVDALQDARLMGASAALNKPFSAETLLKCIRDLAPFQTGQVA